MTFSKDETRDTLGRLADRMLRAFQASSMSHPEGTIIGVEEEFRGALVAGCPDLLARVDLLIDTPTALVVTDLKTSRSRWSQDQAEGSVGQLLLYSELVGRLMPNKPVRLEFAVITKAKAPTVDLLRVAGQKGQIERTKVVVERVWRDCRRAFLSEPIAHQLRQLPLPSAVPDVAQLSRPGTIDHGENRDGSFPSQDRSGRCPQVVLVHVRRSRAGLSCRWPRRPFGCRSGILVFL